MSPALPTAPDDQPDAHGDGGVDVGGGVAHLLADADRPGGWLLTLDRIRQSYVDLDDPTYLDFEYLQGFAEIVDELDPVPPHRLDVTHIGGGALTFARYLQATRPGCSQLVLEPDAALTALVRARLPLPPRSGIRVRPTAGRPGLSSLRDGSADIVVLDAFAGGRVPSDLTTREAIAQIAAVLQPGGVFLANLADGPPLEYTRRVLTTVIGKLPNVVLRTDPAVLKARRFGNLVIAASRAPLPVAQISRRARAAPFPVSVLAGGQLSRFVDNARVLTDADSLRSPAPDEASWRVEGGW